MRFVLGITSSGYNRNLETVQARLQSGVTARLFVLVDHANPISSDGGLGL